MFAALRKLDAFTVAGLARLDELQQEVGLLGRPHGLVQVDVPARFLGDLQERRRLRSKQQQLQVVVVVVYNCMPEGKYQLPKLINTKFTINIQN